MTTWHIGNPTEYGTFNANTVFDEDENAIALVYGLPSNVKLEDLDERDAKALANARLIATAPKLLERLERLVVLLGWRTVVDSDQEEINQAQVVIDEANGQS